MITRMMVTVAVAGRPGETIHLTPEYVESIRAAAEPWPCTVITMLSGARHHVSESPDAVRLALGR
jgi:uncharacterized protein YlzI (FlbEa/FlbD family)